MPQAASLGAYKEYRVAFKEQFFLGAGFGLRLHRRDTCATWAMAAG